jgi:hypothetical protein
MEIRLLKLVKGGFGPAARIAIAMIISAFVLSCHTKPPKPAGILSREQMVSVLKEIYITEEKVNRMVLPRDSAEAIFKLMEGKAFEKTGVSDSVFGISLDYYTDRPEEFELIYTALVDSLQLSEQRVPARINTQ